METEYVIRIEHDLELKTTYKQLVDIVETLLSDNSDNCFVDVVEVKN